MCLSCLAGGSFDSDPNYGGYNTTFVSDSQVGSVLSCSKVGLKTAALLQFPTIGCQNRVPPSQKAARLLSRPFFRTKTAIFCHYYNASVDVESVLHANDNFQLQINQCAAIGQHILLTLFEVRKIDCRTTAALLFWIP